MDLKLSVLYYVTVVLRFCMWKSSFNGFLRESIVSPKFVSLVSRMCLCVHMHVASVGL